MYLGHVALIIKCAQVVEQLQCSHEGFRSRRVHEVKVNLHAVSVPSPVSALYCCHLCVRCGLRAGHMKWSQGKMYVSCQALLASETSCNHVTKVTIETM